MRTADVSAATRPDATRRRVNRRARSEARWGYLLIAPLVIGFSIFFLIALGASLVLSFTRWDMLSSPVWVGFANYRDVLRDAEFRTALWNTVAIAVPNVILRLAFSLALAMALNTNIRFRSFYRILYFMPVITMMKPRREAS